MGWGEGREAGEGEDVYIIMAGLCCCMAETNIVKKNFNINKWDYMKLKNCCTANYQQNENAAY